ncbi:transmembrane protein 141 [Plakobranchus ocellatus]|uniref:Transmembrane protein 141 n=1 Tax=Plakobranchus ocellatus TaxID=259542 RepID=A0AAV4BDX3_9GAST|nr:transmembrane protein 141 [Plakobranchus ocellatus]
MNRSSTESAEEIELLERYPHFKTYKACQSKAFMTGSFTLLMGTACSFLVMDHWFQKFKPTISKNWLIAGPILVGTLSAYGVTMGQTIRCQNMWMAMEDRHSVITSAQERLEERLREEEES